MAGRKPLPTRLKLVKGTLRKHRVNPNEPQPSAGNVSPPAWLSKSARKHWDVTAPPLLAAGLLTDLDVFALGLYCEAHARWVMANAKIEKHGPVVMARSGLPVQSPYVAISNKAFDQMLGLLTEFGMTPSSRSRVSTVKPPVKTNPFDNLGGA
jgi:P27 family predicted phage terminase small subunit